MARTLAAALAVGCFTGDGLLGQPCRSDDDCNAVADVLGHRISCHDQVCGVVCGDGVVLADVEECEDGNDDETDACVGCRNAFCGDGTVWADNEQCDDGNADETDACVGCHNAFCGDNVVWVARERCDDGNDDPHDGCADCEVVECGDGVVHPLAEACDDANADDDDGCTSTCEMGAVRLSTGQSGHTCAIRDGAVRCWGSNDAGELGYGHTAAIGDEPNDLPPADVLVGGRVRDVLAGGFSTCAVLEGGGDNVRCWGSGIYLGVPGFAGDEMPPPPLTLGGAAVQLAGGDAYTCAVLTDHTIRCWGDLSSAWRVDAFIGDDEEAGAFGPFVVGGDVQQIAAAPEHVCVLLVGGDVRCWGNQEFGQLGYPDVFYELAYTGDASLHAPVQLGEKAIQVTAGYFNTCALLAGGTVRCWGTGPQLGLAIADEIVGDDEHPDARDPVDLGGPAVAIDSGGSHTCAVLMDGQVRCWGYNGGALGIGADDTVGDDEKPVKFAPVALDGPVRQLVTASSHTCALMDRGKVRCWGANLVGQLGLGHSRTLGDDPGEMPPPFSILYADP